MSRDKENRHIRENIQGRVAYDIHLKEKRNNIKDRFNPEILNAGKDWYESGFSLDEAPENLKINTNFVNGYERAKRLQDIEDDYFKRGMEAYLAGIPWDKIDDKDKQNTSFVFGYEDAMTMNLGKSR